MWRKGSENQKYYQALLDDASTAALVARLRELRSHGCITLVATHDFEVAEAVVSRVVILQDGRLVSSESDVQGLRRRYQQRLTSPGAPS